MCKFQPFDVADKEMSCSHLSLFCKDSGISLANCSRVGGGDASSNGWEPWVLWVIWWEEQESWDERERKKIPVLRSVLVVCTDGESQHDDENFSRRTP